LEEVLFLLWLGKIAKSLFNISFLTKVEHGKYHMTLIESQKGMIVVMEWSHHTQSHSHSIWQRSQLISNMRTEGNKVYSHDSNCIYSVVNLMGTLLSSLCQMLIKSNWLYSNSGVSMLTILLFYSYYLWEFRSFLCFFFCCIFDL